MSTKPEEAVAYFKQGYNCAQAVVLAYADEIGIDRQTAAKLSSSFGGGMGRLREVCGAVSGMFIVEGLKNGYADPADREAKKAHYARIQKLGEQFRKENGSIVCRELLGHAEKTSEPTPQERTQEYYRKRPCAQLVECAARIVGQEIMK